MRLSRQSDYAIRVMLELASQAQHASDVRAISRRRKLPEAYAGKVVQALGRAGLVVTARGARGGVRLARPPQAISLRQIVEAVEGPTLFTRCMLWPGECQPPRPCALHPILEGLSQAVAGYLDSVSLEALASKERLAARALAEQESGATQPLRRERGSG